MIDLAELTDVCEFLDHRRRPVKESERISGPYPYYGANGLQGWINSYIFDEPLVLLAEDGGHFGSKERPIAYKISGKAWVNNHAHVLRPKSNCDLDYLHHALSYYDVTRFISGSTRLKLTKGDAEGIVIPLPSLEEQKRIAAQLDKADRLRQTRRYAQTLSDTFLQSVFLEMFGDPVTNPKGWDAPPLEDLLSAKVQNGLYIPPDRYESRQNHGIEMVHMSDLFYDVVQRGNLKRVAATPSEIKRWAVTEDDLLIARRSLTFEGAAKPCRIPKARSPLIFESSMIRITPDPKAIDVIYLYYFLSNERAKRQYVLKYVTRSTISGISQDGLNQVQVLCPPLSVQKQFAGIVNRHERLKLQQQEAARQADHLFHSLLHRAFQTEK